MTRNFTAAAISVASRWLHPAATSPPWTASTRCSAASEPPGERTNSGASAGCSAKAPWYVRPHRSSASSQVRTPNHEASAPAPTRSTTASSSWSLLATWW